MLTERRTLGTLYRKYQEVILYIVFGGLTTVVSVVTYILFVAGFCWNVLLANVVSWFFAVLFAFVTNRKWVFKFETSGVKAYFVQMVFFFLSRVSTLLVEEGLLFVFISYLNYPSVEVKIIAQVVVIFLNYVISKLWVFR